MNISFFKSGKKVWNNFVLQKNLNYRSLYEWGEYKESLGWKVLRLIVIYKKETNYLQITYKKALFFGAFYIPDLKIQKINKLKSLVKFLKKQTNLTFIYIRTDDQTIVDKYENKINDLKRPIYRVNNSKLCILNLYEYLQGSITSKNYKKYLLKSSAINKKFVITNQPNPEDLLKITNKMNEFKDMQVHSFKDFDLLNKKLKKYIKFIVLYDENGNPISYRGALIIKDNAWDIAAASSFVGRKRYSGFLSLDALAKNLYEHGIKNYNLGAIDPKMPGVAAFKLSSGAKSLNYIGDYEYSNLFSFKYFINIIIYITLSKKIRNLVPFLSKYNY